MEPRGRKRWRLVANRPTSRTAGIGENCCRQYRRATDLGRHQRIRSCSDRDPRPRRLLRTRRRIRARAVARFLRTRRGVALLAGRGVRVQVVLPGPVDTDMTGASRYRNPLRSRSHGPYSPEGRRVRTRSSLIRCRNRWQRAGVAVWPRRSSARTRRLYKQSPSQHEQR